MVRRLLTSLTLALGLVVVPMTLATAPAYAIDSKTAACQGVGLAIGGGGGCDAESDTKLADIISTIVNLLSIIVGAAAVIMIVVAGFKYVASGGDSNKVSSAKSTLVYAIIGLIIVALAQTIVHFVINNIG